jgi:hypothetical protein
LKKESHEKYANEIFEDRKNGAQKLREYAVQDRESRSPKMKEIIQ